jgi:26S proteasome regulatory subunit (ATPase 3-interacting protein)
MDLEPEVKEVKEAKPKAPPKAKAKKEKDDSAPAAEKPKKAPAKGKAAAITADAPATAVKAKAPAKAKSETAASSAPAANGKDSVSEKDAPEVILSYLRSQNRPYNAQNIFDNLHGAVKKASLQRVLDKLVSDQRVSSKDFGKATVYWPKQDELGVLNVEEQKEMDATIQTAVDELAQVEADVRKAASIRDRLNSAMTEQELSSEILRLTAEISAFEADIALIEGNTEPVDMAGKKKAQDLYDLAVREYKKRRKLCKNILEQLCESVGKKPLDLMEEIGIETDEDHGFVFEDKFAPPPAKRMRK